MKTFAISLIALAALSTASFANSNRSNDLRDTDTYVSLNSAQIMNKASAVNALAVVKTANTVSNFDRLNWISLENDQGGRH